MQLLTTLLATAFALGLIIFIHEAGHLLAARAFNIRVLAFSLGFGKRLWGIQRGETDYRLSLVPLGGYVKLGGEHADEATDDPRDFVNRPRWQRILVYLAGPFMNIVLAVGLFTGVFMVGIEAPPRKLEPVIGALAPTSPADVAGLHVGDRILAIDGQAVDDFNDVQFAVMAAPGRPLALTVERGSERLDLTLTPLRVPKYEIGEAGFVGLGKVRVKRVLPGAPAEQAGLQAGDEIVQVAGHSVISQADFIAFIEQRPDEALPLAIVRAGNPLEISVTPKGDKGAARIGAEISYGYFQRYPFRKAFVESLCYNWDIVQRTFEVLGKVFTGKLAAKGALAGPIEIARISGETARQGMPDFFHLIAFISISIALVNLLPIPILDGGQTLILLIESVLRRDLSMAVKERLAQVGMVLIVALMVTVVFFDLQKQF